MWSQFSPLLLSSSLVAAASIPLSRRAPIPAHVLPNKWTYSGCYVDSIANRSLTQLFQSINDQSGYSCVAHCQSEGFEVAGTEWGRECFCDHEITSAKVDDSECAAPCTGQANEVCGGSERLTVYKPPVYSPKTNPGDGSTFTYLGCYPDSVENRLLPVEPMDGPDVTIPKCVHECRNAGFISNSTHTAYAGVEYGQKCFCGINTVLPDPAPGSLPAVTGCDIPCKGDGNELCGGANHLNIYALTKEADTPIASSSSSVETSSTLPEETSSALPVETPSVPSVETSTSTEISTEAPVTTETASASSTPEPTSEPATSSEIATTSSSSAAATLTLISNQIIENGDFEAGEENWYISLNPGAPPRGNLSYSVTNPSAYAYTGTHFFEVNDAGSDSYLRSFCVTQDAFHPAAGRYSFSAELGRIAAADANGVSDDFIGWELRLDGIKVADGGVCNPYQDECDVAAKNGVLAYRKESHAVKVPSAGYHTYSICPLYVGPKVSVPDTFLLDAVAVYGPA